jgi:Cu(I)/Ag(I) efflux system membrane fusion protein
MDKLKFFVIAACLMVAGISCSNSNSKKNEQATQVEVKETQGTLIVQGVCGMCKTRIEEAAKKVAGVNSASWDSETKELTFNYDAAKTSPESISKAIAKVGHDTNLDQAPDSVYDALHECCKYRTT